MTAADGPTVRPVIRPRSGAPQPRPAVPLTALLTGMLLAGACATPVGVDPIPPQDFQRQVTANALSAGVPSGFSDQVLQRFNLRERFKDEPGAALAELHATLDTEGGENRLFALAELSYLHAEQSGERSHYLASAVYAYAFLFPGAGGPTPDPLDPRTRLAAELYNRALTEGLTPKDGADVVIAAGEHLALRAARPRPAGRRARMGGPSPRGVPANPGSLPLSWKVLLSGHAAEYAHDQGRLDTSLPFEELRRRSRINAAAVAADRAPDFSRRIREGLPGMRDPATPRS